VDNQLGYVLHGESSVQESTMNWMETLSQQTHRRCSKCQSDMQQILFYNQVPPVLILEYPFMDIETSHTLQFETDKGIKSLRLKGIVYYGQYHFTSRIISTDNKVWFHDGMTTGESCSYDGMLDKLSDADVRKCRDKTLVLAIYA
jgi:hypothetical protein